MDNVLSFTLVTPTEVVFQGEISSVIVRTDQGELAIHPGHEHALLSLVDGDIRLFSAEGKKVYTVFDGLLLAQSPEVVITASFASFPEDVDRLRAEYLEKLEESYLREMQSGLELQRAELALHRSLIHGTDIPDSVLSREEDAHGR